jgi:hypothetical protein
LETQWIDLPLAFALGQGRQKQSRQDTNDCDHYQEFDESETDVVA